MTDTKVVNVRVKNIRPKFDNLKEWMQDADNVYIGRAGVVFVEGRRFPPEQSAFANPFKVDKSTTREQAISKYRSYISEKIQAKELDLNVLRGKRLGCWCKPEDCHGDVLIELLSAQYEIM